MYSNCVREIVYLWSFARKTLTVLKTQNESLKHENKTSSPPKIYKYSVLTKAGIPVLTVRYPPLVPT